MTAESTTARLTYKHNTRHAGRMQCIAVPSHLQEWTCLQVGLAAAVADVNVQDHAQDEESHAQAPQPCLAQNVFMSE
jgi:hypothetical protein